MSKRQVRIETVKDCDRTFILFGKSNSGKSALGNLILGPHATTHFSTHPLHTESSGHTKKMQSGESEIDATLAYGECYTGNNTVKIQVIDQPGCNDNNYFSFSNQCFEESRTVKNITFLIVINLFAKFFSEDEFLTIMKIAEILSENQYCVFSNAILVFTHADMIDKNLKNEKLEEKIQDNLQKENYGYIRELLTVLGDKYIFVNAVNYSGTNRHNVLKKICQRTKSILTVQINENYSFKGDELKLLLGGEADANIIKETAPECDIDYCFSSNFKTIERYDLNILINGIMNALNKLSCISNGISTIVILINLEEMFTEEIYNNIINLPNTYNLRDKSKHHFWDYACIVFKARMDSKAFVRRQIEANPKLKNLDRMVQSRYCWITNRSIPEECYERLGDLVKEITSSNKLKIYTDITIVTEMRDTMQESFMNIYSYDRETPPEIEREELPPEGKLCQPLSPRNALLSINNRFWITEHTGISTLIGYFIWKNINANIAKQFKIQYPDDVRISADAFVDFCLEFK